MSVLEYLKKILFGEIVETKAEDHLSQFSGGPLDIQSDALESDVSRAVEHHNSLLSTRIDLIDDF